MIAELSLGLTRRSRACPAIVHPGTPVGQVAALLPCSPGPPPAGLPPPPIPRPRRVRQAHPDPGVWLRLPPHRRPTCSATTLRRRRDEWINAGVAERLRLAVLAAYDRMLGLQLEHLAVDGCITKAPCGGQTAGPQARWTACKQGLKRSVVTEAGGIPLGAVPAPANHRDDGLLVATLDTLTVVGGLPDRPVVHLDAGYDYQPSVQVPGRTGHGRADRRAWETSPIQVSRPLAARADPCVGQPVRQAALVYRAPPGGGGVLAGEADFSAGSPPELYAGKAPSPPIPPTQP